MEDDASQRAGTDDNRLDLEIPLVRANVDRCSIQQFPIDIGQTRPAPIDPRVLPHHALALIGKLGGGLIVRSGGQYWLTGLWRRVLYLIKDGLTQIEELGPAAVRGPAGRGKNEEIESTCASDVEQPFPFVRRLRLINCNGRIKRA